MVRLRCNPETCGGTRFTRHIRLDARVFLVAALALVASGCAPAAIDRPSESSAPSPSAQGSAGAGPSASSAAAVASTDAGASELLVACDGTSTEIPVPLVKAQPDGIHVRFDNTSGRLLDVSWSDGSGNPLSDDSIPASGGTYVYTLGVGDYEVACSVRPSSFAVVDPDRLYRPAVTWCDSQDAGGSDAVGVVDFGLDARGLRGDVVDIARMKLDGLALGDVVEHAGYPKAAGEQSVRVVRLGRVVAVLDFVADGHGGWLIGGTHTCQGSNVTVKG
jgi:hypothetical protein